MFTFASNVTMEHHIGFNGQFQLEKWSPVTIILDNRGRAIKGALEIVVTSGSEYRGDIYRTIHSMDVELPTNSKKRCSFTILLNAFSHPLLIQLKEAQKVILSESVNLRSYYVEKGLAIMVSGKMVLDYLSILPKEVHPLITRPQFLPELWYGYDGIKMLIMHADVLKVINNRQIHALKGWIRRGGYIIITGGFNYGALLEERAKTLLSVDILGFERINRLKSMESFCGHKFEGGDPFLIIKAVIEDSEVLLKEDDIPIIIQKGLGLGKIIFMAFDFQTPPFGSWDGRSRFWEKLYSLRPDRGLIGFDLDMQLIYNSLISAIPTRFPSFIITFILLLTYLILIKSFLKRVKRKGVVMWGKLGFFITTIVVFSLICWWLFFLASPQKALTYNSLIHIKKAGKDIITPCKEIMGLFALKNVDYKLILDLQHRPFTPVPAVKSAYGNHSLKDIFMSETSSDHALSVPLKKWSHCFLTMDSLVNFPLEGKVSRNEQGLFIAFENRTSHRIMDCSIYFAGRLFHFGNIEPSSNGEFKITNPEMMKKELYQEHTGEYTISKGSDNASGHLLKKVKKNLLKEILKRTHSRYSSRQDVLYLFGWFASGVIKVHFDQPDIWGEDVGLIEWEMPVATGKNETIMNNVHDISKLMVSS
ncbi:hypothetical protein ACFLZG_07830, partial [Thermodesulfobacteriota bacterium]